jgi:hypothetical protein
VHSRFPEEMKFFIRVSLISLMRQGETLMYFVPHGYQMPDKKHRRRRAFEDDGEFESIDSEFAKNIIASDIPGTYVDRYGVYQLHPTIEGGKEAFGIYESKNNDNNILQNADFGHERGIRHYQSCDTDPTDEWNAKMPKKHVNLEATAYFRISKPQHDDTISIKLRGPNHSDGYGSWYIIGTTFYQGKPHFQKEYNHDDGNEDVEIGNRTRSVGNIVDKWIGIKAITITEGRKVRCKCFVDIDGLINDAPANIWVKTFDVLDGDRPILKGNQRKENDDNLQIQFRIDGCGRKNDDELRIRSNYPIDANFMSCRQV